MSKSVILYTFLIFAFMNAMSAQEFQKAFADFNVANDITQDQEGNLYIGGYTTFFYEASVDKIISLDIINKLDAQGQEIWSRNFVLQDAFTEIHKVLTLENGDLIALFSIDENNTNLQLGLARISANGSLQWSKSIAIEVATFDEFNTEVNLISGEGNSFYVQSKKINETQQTHLLSLFNEAGQAQWTRAYTFDLKINLSSVLSIDETELALIGYYTTDTNTTQGMLMIIDKSGQLVKSSAYDDVQLLSIIPDGDQYILKVKYAISNQLGLLKLDADLNVVWSKEYNFEIEGQVENMQKMGQDAFAVYCYDNRSRTEMLGLFDMNGEQVWSKLIASKYSGRPFYEKVMRAGDQILIMSHIWTTDLKASILRQIPFDGNTLECILPNFCLESRPFDTDRQDLQVVTGSATISEMPVSLSLSEVNKDLIPFCEEEGGIPSPLFDLDNTACVNEAIFISNLQSDGADAISWGISGGPEEAILPLAEFSEGVPIMFPDSGLYTITQFVEFRNCTNAFEQEVYISEPAPFAFTDDVLILCQDEIETVNANRPAFLTYLWLDDQSADPIKKIDVPGIYTVALFDGECTKEYSLEAVDFDYSEVAFSLGPDTTVCEFRLFNLTADVINTGVDYKWNDGPVSAARPANKAGLYTLTANLEGCDFKDDIFVTFESCEAQVYMPNIFSPNTDGFNDELFPQGKNFELMSYRVYNRWGALLHDGLGPWDGRTRGERVLGTYVYNITFLNFRSGDVESLTGDVFLQL